jgi:phenylacetate-CoA ligase
MDANALALELHREQGRSTPVRANPRSSARIPPHAEGETLSPLQVMTRRLQMALIRVCLVPLDLLLRVVGPNYRLFYWFFLVAPPAIVAWLGRLRAIRAAANAARTVPAYRAFLQSHNVDVSSSVSTIDLPPTDKRNYIDVFPPDARCVGGRIPLIGTTTDESSGSTGTPYNWVRSLQERHASHQFVSHFARYCFGAEPWITINAFSMGAWATGVNMGIALQANSMVKNTGPDLDKIFSTLEHFGPAYRYLVCGYPPFLKHLIDISAERGFPLERYRFMALLGGEGNSEGLRDYLARYFAPIYSGYGATDLEIGVAGETPLSLAIRRQARTDQRLRHALFGDDSRLPMLFQYNPLMYHIETDERRRRVDLHHHAAKSPLPPHPLQHPRRGGRGYLRRDAAAGGAVRVRLRHAHSRNGCPRCAAAVCLDLRPQGRHDQCHGRQHLLRGHRTRPVRRTGVGPLDPLLPAQPGRAPRRLRSPRLRL